MSYCTECGTEIADGLSTCTDCDTGGVAAETPAADAQATDPERRRGQPSLTPLYAGSALSVVGAFLPWTTILEQSVTGIDVDGSIMLVLGIVAAAVAYARPWDRKSSIGTAAIGGVIAFIALADMTNFAGSSIYVTLVGGLLVAYPGAREQLD